MNLVMMCIASTSISSHVDAHDARHIVRRSLLSFPFAVNSNKSFSHSKATRKFSRATFDVENFPSRILVRIRVQRDNNLMEGEEKKDINLMCEPRVEAEFKGGKRLIIIAIL